jgi:hypothetical protein
MASLKDDYISVDHVTSTKAYALLGNPGALGLMNAVNIPWDKCPATWQYVFPHIYACDRCRMTA